MTGPTINDALDLYQSIRTQTVAEPKLLPHALAPLRRGIGHMPAASVDQGTVDSYVAWRTQAGCQPQTARRDLTILRAALHMAAKRGHIQAAPVLVLPPPGRRRIRVLTPDEVTALMREAGDPRIRLFVALALATGARRQALCELTWDRVDLDSRLIDLRAPHPRAAQRKGRAVVPISERLADMLAMVRPTSGTGPVIGLRKHAVNYHFNKARDRAGLGPDVTPHVLRHTAASIMVKSVPLIIASKMLGHSSTSITESVYVHLLADDLRAAADATAVLLPVAAPETAAAPPPRTLWHRLTAWAKRGRPAN